VRFDLRQLFSLRPTRWARTLAAVALLGLVHCGGSAAELEPRREPPRPTTTDRPAPGPLSSPGCLCGTEPGCPPCAPAPSASSRVEPPSSGPPLVFPPKPIPPIHARTAKPGDGEWTPLTVRSLPAGQTSPLFTTVVRPHPIRNFVVVQLVAIDTTRLDLDLILGTEEPEGTKLPLEKRPGKVAATDLDRLVAVLNGGFKKRHGQHGVGKAGEIAQEPNADGCTFAKLADGSYRVRSHSKLLSLLEGFQFFRQTPPCLVEDGAKNRDTEHELKAKKWGGAEDGNKEIRRSAIGLAEDGRVLYFAIGDYLTASWLADGLVAVGIRDAAELDINYSYTRFILYQPAGNGELTVSSPLLTDLKAPRNEYWREASGRDFFTLLWKR
jgi:hypothetical protein